MPDDMFALPPRQDTAAAWLGPDLAHHPERWTTTLSPDQVSELEHALSGAVSRGTIMADITKESFTLPLLGPVLADLQNELVHGRGFALVRGLDVDKYTEQEIAMLFFGLGSHLGNARSQNAAGDILGHVQDLGAKGSDTSVRIYQTSERQTFHTDSCDVVGLICLQAAKSGGASMLVSAVSLYNAFLEMRPDLLTCLFDPIATDRRGEIPVGMKPYFEIPVFSWHQGYLSVMYQRQYIDSAQRFPDAMRLTPDHVEALDLFDTLANDPNMHLIMMLEPGDIQLVHNHNLLHDRMGFEDWPAPDRRRHLLRLWLSVPGDRPLPDCFAERFGSTKIGDRGGIVVSG
ncbi:MAG: TauD/TfdA family dioxygenase [Alphaproteobacteria bacterium]